MASSLDWITRAKECIPGGVNSPVRAHVPAFFHHAQGPYLYDTTQKRYIDYVGGFGPSILGHSQPKVVAAIQNAATHGLCYGGSHPGEVRLAEYLCAALPSMEQVRLVNSGTEACMSAIRIARAATNRALIVKCIGG